MKITKTTKMILPLWLTIVFIVVLMLAVSDTRVVDENKDNEQKVHYKMIRWVDSDAPIPTMGVVSIMTFFVLFWCQVDETKIKKEKRR